MEKSATAVLRWADAVSPGRNMGRNMGTDGTYPDYFSQLVKENQWNVPSGSCEEIGFCLQFEDLSWRYLRYCCE